MNILEYAIFICYYWMNILDNETCVFKRNALNKIYKYLYMFMLFYEVLVHVFFEKSKNIVTVPFILITEGGQACLCKILIDSCFSKLHIYFRKKKFLEQERMAATASPLNKKLYLKTYYYYFLFLLVGCRQ